MEACAHSSRPPPALQTSRRISDVSANPESVTELRVRYAETDQMGIVYHAHYLVWCEIARTDLIRTLGASYRELEERGIRLAVAEASLRYIAPARYDDRIRIETRLIGVTSRTLIFDYTIVNADSSTRLATARTTLISLDPENRVAALPLDVRRALAGDTERSDA
jgi:acyl-CoA thioester hydrolase